MTQVELIKETFRAAPPITVTGLTVFGVPIADWVAVATLLYIVLQVYFLLKEKVFKNGRNR